MLSPRSTDRTIPGTWGLIVDVLYHKPQLSVRLATHAESAPPDAVRINKLDF